MLRKKEKKYSFADIIDIVLMSGGIFFGILFFFGTMFLNHNFMIPKPAVFIMLLSFFTGGLGSMRLLLRQKEKKIEELEELLPPQYVAMPNPHFPLQPIQPNTIPPQQNPQVIVDLEVKFLEAITQKNGKITLIEAVVLTRESIDKLLPIIEKLQNKGVLGTEILENGQIVYVAF
jgi:hypothetical protein